MKKIVINAFGRDRVGIVSEITEIVHGFGGNVEKSHMSKLDQDFAVIMLATIKSSISNKSLLSKLNTISNLSVHVNETNSSKIGLDNRKWEIVVNGADHEGIIYYISDILRKNDVNIIELITKTVNAPVTGSALFNMKLIFSCEDKDLISRIKKTISSKAKKLNLEIIIAKK